ncbi:MAG TPA: class I SAM-dependent methyltransferase, partial [Sphingomonas sp.]|nr:class I SAM-dependent methyltransferase [Sphingomonas sp.]
VAIALAPYAREVIGLDLSPNMLAEARERGSNVFNLRFVEGNGRDLAMLATDSIDVALAADSFPFIVRTGAEVMEAIVAEVARVLRKGGDFLIFNWSYRGDVGRDIAEAYGFAEAFGFTVLRAGERPFRLWDGIGFQLRRAA